MLIKFLLIMVRTRRKCSTLAAIQNEGTYGFTSDFFKYRIPINSSKKLKRLESRERWGEEHPFM